MDSCSPEEVFQELALGLRGRVCLGVGLGEEGLEWAAQAAECGGEELFESLRQLTPNVFQIPKTIFSG